METFSFLGSFATHVRTTRPSILTSQVPHSPVLHPEDEVAPASLTEVVGNRLGKRRSPRHVVCSVDHDRGAAVHDLETSGDDDRAEGLLDDIVGQRRIEEFLDGRQRQRGILGLVSSVQRQEHLVVEAPRRAYAEQAAAEAEKRKQAGGPLLAQAPAGPSDSKV